MEKTQGREGPDDGQYRGKKRQRMRVSRACDQCRVRKDRCDGQQPVCGPCAKGNRSCTYVSFTKKRGLPPGYVRGLEILLGLVFRHVEGSEDLVSAVLRTELNASGSTIEDSRPGLGPTAGQNLTELWRKSSAVKQMEQLLSAAGPTEDDVAFTQRLDERIAQAALSVQKRKGTHHEDLSFRTSNSLNIPRDGGDMATFESPFETRDPSQPNLNAHISLSSFGNTTSHQSLDVLNTSIPISGSERALEFPSNWSQLLDLYFANTHSWFPISQKHDLLRPAHLLANGTSSQRDSVTLGERAFLWAVFAYTSHQCSIAQSDVPTHSSEALCTFAKNLLPVDAAIYEIGHVRSLLLLALLRIGSASWAAAWVLVGQAVYSAIDLRLFPQKAHSSVNIPFHSLDDGQKRTAMGCFLLDTFVSAQLARRPHLKRSDLQLVGLPQVDGNEEWEPWHSSTIGNSQNERSITPRHGGPARALSIFNQFLNLTALLNDFVCQPDNSSVESLISTVSQRLDRWREALPKHCQPCHQEEFEGQQTPQLLNLSLASAAISAFLQLQVGLVSTVTRPIPPAFARQLPTHIAEQTEKYGLVSVPPVFRIYLSFCDCSPAVGNEDAVQQIRNEMQSVRTRLLGDIRRYWGGSGNANKNQVDQDSFENSLFASALPSANNFVAPTKAAHGRSTKANILNSNLSSQHSKTTNMTTFKRAEQHIFAHSQTAFTGGSTISSLTAPPQSSELADFSGSLMSNLEADTLLNSLALLEPVDWTANQPEFMEHLGFTGEFIQADYESFFNR
ncbi:hypothetical protein BDZ45DRAFT_740236 [Acephala macrosclerotiorum]|nr:hypothetical protein BDZ45DRAFT_740236 [Acephala macrosclerotiorum]